MTVILAKHAGFCFGVKRAVEGAFELADEGKKLCTLGQLIHNASVVEHLEAAGIRCIDTIDEVREGESVIIRSHGVPESCYKELEKRGIEYYDLTCPFVDRIHKKVAGAADSCDLIVIVGTPDHPEVQGIYGWAGKNARIVPNVEEAEKLPHVKHALVVAQTTIKRELLDSVYEVVKTKADETELFNSICETTRLRQNETMELAKKSDAMVVIGDRNSSNTGKLYEIAKKNCKNTQYIESADELLLENFYNCGIISIVAGASAPDWIIREVKTRMNDNENTLVNGEEVVAEVQESKEVAVAAEEVEQNVAADEATVAQETAAEVKTEKAHEDAKDGDQDFLAALEETFVKIKPHQFITGKVSQVSDDEVCVSIEGYKADGIIKRDDLALPNDVTPADRFKIDDEIEAEVIKMNDGEGRVLLSRKKIESQIKWRALVEELDQNKIYQCKVSKVIKGGVLSKLEGYDAFIPASQLSLKYVEDLNVFIGQTLDVKIIDIDKRQKRFVLSHKEVLKDRAEEEEKKLFESFEKGTVIKGTVKRLTDFGAFVDIGGVDGLLHITDISWARINHPKDVLSENQEIEVKILNVDPEKKKISLGYKQLQPKPWDLVPEKYHVGDIIDGKVVRIAPFGAFVELEPTIDGLIHISQVSDRRIEKVEDVLSLGQEVKVKVMEVSPEKRRISLSMRALIDKPAPQQPQQQEKEEDASARGGRKEKRDREEKFSYTIPPVEEATTSLADLFTKLEK